MTKVATANLQRLDFVVVAHIAVALSYLACVGLLSRPATKLVQRRFKNHCERSLFFLSLGCNKSLGFRRNRTFQTGVGDRGLNGRITGFLD